MGWQKFYTDQTTAATGVEGGDRREREKPLGVGTHREGGKVTFSAERTHVAGDLTLVTRSAEP